MDFQKENYFPITENKRGNTRHIALNEALCQRPGHEQNIRKWQLMSKEKRAEDTERTQKVTL